MLLRAMSCDRVLSNRSFGMTDRLAATAILCGVAAAFLGTAVLCLRIEMLGEVIMDEGLGGLDWTGRGAIIWIPATTLLLPIIVSRSRAAGSRFRPHQLGGALLIFIYWSLFPALHVVEDFFRLPDLLSAPLYSFVAPYAFTWRWAEALLVGSIPYGALMFVPVFIVFAASTVSVGLWFGMTSFVLRYRAWSDN